MPLNVECECKKDSKSSFREYLEKIRPHLRDIVDYLEKSGEWKIKLTVKHIFMSSVESNENHTTYSKSHSRLVVIGNDTDEFIQNLFDSFLHNYQIGLENSMIGSNCIFDYVSEMYHVCQKTTMNRGGSYIDSPEWIKNKKVTINSKNDDDNNCFQYAITVALNHDQIGGDPQRAKGDPPLHKPVCVERNRLSFRHKRL